jgi:hypothetical protein
MKTHELRSLQALRQLREQRAASELVSRQRQCMETERELSSAKERLHLHRDRLAQETQQLYTGLSEGLPVAHWQEASARLDALTCNQSLLETAANEVTRQLVTHLREREGSRLEHVARQRQCEAWDTLLDQRQHVDLRAEELREDADEGIPLPATVVSGAT